MHTRRFSLQELMIVLGIILVLIALSFPMLHQGKMSGQETSAVATLKTIFSAQERYKKTHENVYGNMGQLIKAGLLDPGVGRADRDRHGYEFHLIQRKRKDNWVALAWPSEWGVTGTHLYLISSEGVIYKTKQELATDRATARAWLRGSAYGKSYDPKDLAAAGFSTLDGGAKKP